MKTWNRWKKYISTIPNNKISDEESESKYITYDRTFKEDIDIIKYATTETDNWMAICKKLMQEKIDPGLVE